MTKPQEAMSNLCVYLTDLGLGHIGWYSHVTHPRESQKGHLSHGRPQATETESCMVTGKNWGPSCSQCQAGPHSR